MTGTEKSENIKNYAAAIQSIIFAISLPLAGYWTFATFKATNQAKLAEIQVEKEMANLEPNSSLSVGLVSEVYYEKEGQFIYTTAKIENNGNTKELFKVSEEHISTYFLSRASTNLPNISRCKSYLMEHPGGEISEHSLHPGESTEIAFISHAPSAGLYSLELRIPIETLGHDGVSSTWTYIGTEKILIPES